MRVFAFYLPQFHRIPENDRWWGEGYTEWTSVRAARPLYPGHAQPVVPLGGRYYDLLDPEVPAWQTELMHRYGVDGLIYYHYYFNGHLLLEKPAENLLARRDLDQPFFFCWANHAWRQSRRQQKLLRDKCNSDAQASFARDGSRILIHMDYGGEADWERHFQYLLPFFEDPRYEKKDGRPLLMLFEPDFGCRDAMMAYFDRRCRESGLGGLCVIDTCWGRSWPADLKTAEAAARERDGYVYLRQPAVAQAVWNRPVTAWPGRLERKIRKVLAEHAHSGRWPRPAVWDGPKLLARMMRAEQRQARLLSSDRIIRGLWFSWDNTPRHGAAGYVITPLGREDVRQYVREMRGDEAPHTAGLHGEAAGRQQPGAGEAYPDAAAHDQTTYLFVNAWNEWAEGMMLEPTEAEGYRYLEWLQEATRK